MTCLYENGFTKRKNIFQFLQPMMRLSRTLRLREHSGEGLPQAPQHIHTYYSMYTDMQWLGSLPWSPDLTLDLPRGGRKNFLTDTLTPS